MSAGQDREQRVASWLRHLSQGRGAPLERAGSADDPRNALENLPAIQGVAVDRLRRHGADLADTEARLLRGESVHEDALATYEAIILPRERPVFRVFDDAVHFDNADRAILDPELGSLLDPADPGGLRRRWVRAVCRINLLGRTDIPYAGTAFVVGPNHILTNRHVARLFAYQHDASFALADYLQPHSSFGHERTQGETGAFGDLAGETFKIVGVDWIHPYWDAALVRLPDGALDNRPHLTLSATELRPGDVGRIPVAVVGYPTFKNIEAKYNEVQRLVFRGQFGVKRFQPGFIRSLAVKECGDYWTSELRQVLTHDASTLGGNSGSAVIDLRSGEVVGLHFAGTAYEENLAVPAFELAREPRARPWITFRPPGVLPGPPPPWASELDKTLTPPTPPKSTTEATTGAPSDLHRLSDDALLSLAGAETLSPDMQGAVIRELASRGDMLGPPTVANEAPTALAKGVIIYLPGIMGSHLADVDTGQAYWINVLSLIFSRTADHLRIDPDRLGPRIRPDGVVDLFYGTAIRRWRAAGLTVVPFAYDWRLPFPDLADDLGRVIARARETHGDTPVWLVGHSMGGVVAATWAARHQEALGEITGAITVGSPLAGAFTPLEAVRGTYNLLKTIATLSSRHDAADLQQMAASFPGLLGMLPDPEVFTAGEPVTKLFQESTWGPVRPRPALLQAAKKMKALLRTSPIFEKTTTIVADDAPTLAGYRLGDDQLPIAGLREWGDGTVPARSQSHPAAAAAYVATGHRHAFLMRHSGVIDAVTEIVRGQPVTALPAWTRPSSFTAVDVQMEAVAPDADLALLAKGIRERALAGTSTSDDLARIFDPAGMPEEGCCEEGTHAHPGLEGTEAVAELSGRAWVARFPTGKTTTSLIQPFRGNVQRFITALEHAGVRVSITATYRPPERAYLMHYATRIAKGELRPEQVPPMAGVDIQWAHPTSAAAVKAAKEMSAAYGIVYPPALNSRHTQGRAVDMNIQWTGRVTVRDASGAEVVLDAAKGWDGNPALHAVGATYGVIKLTSDRPHWSDDGH